MIELFGREFPKVSGRIQENSRFLETSLGDRRINPLRARHGSTLSSQCLKRRPDLLPPTTVNLADLDLESDGRGQPDRRDFTDRSAARGACRGLRAMSKDYIGFQSGNRRRLGIAALYDAGLIRIQSGRRDRIDCRSAGRNRVARIERQYFATDDGCNERRRGAPFGSDQQNRPSSGWWQEYETDLT